MARKSKVINIYRDDYYKRQHSEIANTPIDYTRLRENPLSQEQIAEVKRKFSISDYGSKIEFETHHAQTARTAIVTEIRKMDMSFASKQEREQYIDREVQSRVQKEWEYVQHRELLIESGQYEEIRLKQYKEQYVSHLKLANMDYETIANVEKLSDKEWEQLISFPDATPNSPGIRALPAIQDVYSYTNVTNKDKNTVIKDEIKEAFKDAGLTFETYNEEDNPDTIKRKNFKKLATAAHAGRIKITYDRNSKSYYIPDLGDTRYSKIAKDFMDYYRERYKNE